MQNAGIRLRRPDRILIRGFSATLTMKPMRWIAKRSLIRFTRLRSEYISMRFRNVEIKDFV